MKGSAQSINNVHEVGRLLRLEKMRNEFYSMIFNIFAFLLALLSVYIAFLCNKTTAPVAGTI